MRNKRAMQFQAAFFSIIAVSVAVIAAGVILADWNITYGSGIAQDLGGFNKLDDISGTAQSQKTGVTVKSSNADVNFEDSSIRGVYGVISNIYEPFRIVFGDNGMLDSVTERLGLPDYIRQALVTLMIMAITFALVKIIFRLSRTP